MTRTLTSTRNPRVRRIASLARRRERRLTGLHLAEGPNCVRAALAAGMVESLLVTEESWLDELGVVGGSDDVEVTVTTDAVMRRVCDAVTPQGVVAVVRAVTATLDDVGAGGVLLVLDGVADPGNVGTALRSAHAFGARAVALTGGCADVFGPKAVRSAAGATYRLPVIDAVAVHDLVEACRVSARRLVVLDAAAGTSLEQIDASTHGVALVVGSEAHGVGGELTEAADERVAIRMSGDAESLNAAVASAIALYALSVRREPSEREARSGR